MSMFGVDNNTSGTESNAMNAVAKRIESKNNNKSQTTHSLSLLLFLSFFLSFSVCHTCMNESEEPNNEYMEDRENRRKSQLDKIHLSEWVLE